MSICIGCGLCCDGTLFGTVDLKPGDSPDRLTLGGVNVYVDDAGTHSFAQPCDAFSGQACDVYDERPSACDAFSCNLRNQVLAGEVTEVEARSVIDHARQLGDELRPRLAALVGSAETVSLSLLYRHLRNLLDESSDRRAVQRAHADLLFDVVAFRRMLAARFVEPTGREVRTPTDS